MFGGLPRRNLEIRWHEMPDTVIIGRLSYYGRVLSFRRDRGVATGIPNGVRTARMRLQKSIPSAVRIAGESVFISYPGQPKTCRKCGDLGHLAQGCNRPRCYNCECRKTYNARAQLLFFLVNFVYDVPVILFAFICRGTV